MEHGTRHCVCPFWLCVGEVGMEGGWRRMGDAKRLRRKEEDPAFGDGRCCVCRIEILCERVGRNIIML